MTNSFARAQFLIDGEWRDATGGGVRSITNPSTNEVVFETCFGSHEDADLVLGAAQRAFPKWATTLPAERAAVLRRAGTLLRERVQSVAAALTLEQGKPLVDSIREVEFTAKVFEYYADLGSSLHGRWATGSRTDLRSIVVNQPAGVAVAIVPWNYPVDLLAWKVAPALLAGCTVVVKPSPVTPMSTALTVACLHDAGVPPGVVNSVVGGDEDVSSVLVTDPRSRVIALTGSVGTGRKVMHLAADRLKRVNLELGGHTPFIVLEDADLDEAVAAAVQRSYTNMGQICIAVNRVFVQESIQSEFLDAMTARVREIEVDDGMKPDVAFGPMATSGQLSLVDAQVQDAVGKGATLLAGGAPRGDLEGSEGNFYLPTLLADVPDDALVMSEETFGPITPVVGFDTVDEVVRRANDTEFGLAAYVYGQDLNRTLDVAERLEVGGVGININDITELQAPFGGWKLSGIGRELGPEGLDAYQEPKHIRVALSPPA